MPCGIFLYSCVARLPGGPPVATHKSSYLTILMPITKRDVLGMFEIGDLPSKGICIYG